MLTLRAAWYSGRENSARAAFNAARDVSGAYLQNSPLEMSRL